VDYWFLRRRILKLVAIGAIAQVVLCAYYLAMAHDPHPRGLHVGYSASDGQAPQVEATIEHGTGFSAVRYSSPDEMVNDIRRKDIYGGVDLTVTPIKLYVATAAGPGAATALRSAFSAVTEQQKQEKLDALKASGESVPLQVVEDLAAPPTVVDLVPLPVQDRAGASIGFLVQCLAVGATVATMGMAQLRQHIQPSLRRAVGHTVALLTYATGSAAAVFIAGHLFGVIPDGRGIPTFAMFLLLSAAITFSVAGLVSLIGPAGANLGTAYFVFGVVISGASIVPEFLPAAGRALGQSLPTGAGATAIRDTLYFPDASITRAVAVLSTYVLWGLVLIVVRNLRDSRNESVLVVRNEGALGGLDDDEPLAGERELERFARPAADQRAGAGRPDDPGLER
jgi:hypothetical protein